MAELRFCEELVVAAATPSILETFRNQAFNFQLDIENYSSYLGPWTWWEPAQWPHGHALCVCIGALGNTKFHCESKQTNQHLQWNVWCLHLRQHEQTKKLPGPCLSGPSMKETGANIQKLTQVALFRTFRPLSLMCKGAVPCLQICFPLSDFSSMQTMWVRRHHEQGQQGQHLDG